MLIFKDIYISHIDILISTAGFSAAAVQSVWIHAGCIIEIHFSICNEFTGRRNPVVCSPIAGMPHGLIPPLNRPGAPI